MADIEHDTKTTERLAQGFGGNFYGVYPAIVIEYEEDGSQPRILVRFPWTGESGDVCEVWARFAAMSAGPRSGVFFLPQQGDEVLVAFEAGDMARPYVVGGLWNGRNSVPWVAGESSRDRESDGQIGVTGGIAARSGITIGFDDDTPALVIETPGGQKIVVSDGPGTVHIQDSNGNTIEMNAEGIKIDSASKVTVNASSAEVAAPYVYANTPVFDVNGMIKCQTLQSESVISASYTPGAGNIW